MEKEKENDYGKCGTSSFSQDANFHCRKIHKNAKVRL